MIAGAILPGGWDHAVTFARLLERLHRDKHTGPVTIHFGQGVPSRVEIPGEPTRITLDRATEKAHAS